MNNIKEEKFLAAKEAVKHVETGQVVGLGTGSTAYFAIAEIGEMIKSGLRIKAIPTSSQTEDQARSLGIELVSVDDVDAIDLTIDGTDEFDDNLNLIKGGGGALLKEKMVARITKKQVIIADSSKKVDVLGVFMIPVEVLPFTVNYVQRRISELGGAGNIRMKEGKHFLTDEENYIIDADFGEIEDPYDISDKLNNIEGVVCNGLFLDLADVVIMGTEDGIVTFEK
ncbi:MAG: ribose-5-phosphate isomerase RpiA [Pyrinomonadaceae bacterium]|nr:ribose-5-phosphate isomerase RpiA [Pyrinomonadaceae bacterium]